MTRICCCPSMLSPWYPGEGTCQSQPGRNTSHQVRPALVTTATWLQDALKATEPGRPSRRGRARRCRGGLPSPGGMGHLGAPWTRSAEWGPTAWRELWVPPSNACVLAGTADEAAARTGETTGHTKPGQADDGPGRVRHSLHPAHGRPHKDRTGLQRVQGTPRVAGATGERQGENPGRAAGGKPLTRAAGEHVLVVGASARVDPEHLIAMPDHRGAFPTTWRTKIPVVQARERSTRHR